MATINEDTHRRILEMVGQGQSHRTIAKELGIGVGTVSEYRHRPLASHVEICSPLEIQQSRTINRLRLENNTLRRVNSKVFRAGGYAADDAIDELRKFLANNPAAFKPTYISKQVARAVPPVSPDHKETAACCLSDWHLGETVSLEDSVGINQYNSVIAANRLYEWTQTVKQIICLHQAMYPIEKIWVPVLGDMINGTIHEEFLFSNDLTDAAATVLAARLLEMVVLELTTLGIPIELDCIVGNHPRQTAKMPTKAQAQTSFDWIVYEMAKAALSSVPNVRVNVHTGQMALVKVYGWTYLIEHGIDVRNGHEEEYEDKIRALFDDPIYRESTGLQGASFDQIVVGNLHKPKFLERTIVNGSLTGQNELGMSWRLKPIRAQQLMWGLSKNHVRTWQYAVDLTRVRSEYGENSFSKFALEFMRHHSK